MMILVGNVLIGSIKICNSLLLLILLILYSTLPLLQHSRFQIHLSCDSISPNPNSLKGNSWATTPTASKDTLTMDQEQLIWHPTSQPAIPTSDNTTLEWGSYKSEQTKLIVTMTTKKFTSKFNWDLHVTAQIDELQMIVKVTQPLTGSQWYKGRSSHWGSVFVPSAKY